MPVTPGGTVNLRRGLLKTSIQTTYPKRRQLERVGTAPIFGGLDTDVIWTFAGLTSAQQRQSTTSRTVVRFSYGSIAQLTGTQPPMSTHSSVQHWAWGNPSPPKIHIHLRDSYAIPITKYERVDRIDSHEDRPMRTSEYVLLPGTLSLLRHENSSSHMVHRSDQYIVCARQTGVPQRIVVAVDATLQGAFAALVAQECTLATARFILPTRKPKVQLDDEAARRNAAIKLLAARRAAARAAAAAAGSTKGAKRARVRAAVARPGADVVNLT